MRKRLKHVTTTTKNQWNTKEAARKEKIRWKSNKTYRKQLKNSLSYEQLSINGSNAPIKWCRLAECINKKDPTICCLQETHFRSNDIHRLKMKRQEKIVHANGNLKRAGARGGKKKKKPILSFFWL